MKQGPGRKANHPKPGARPKPRPRRAPPSSGAATYVFALVRAARAPALGKVVGAVPPAVEAPRVLPLGAGLWLVVSTAPLADYEGSRIDARLRSDLPWVGACADGHERVIRHVMGRAGKDVVVLPFKLFTLFTSDERAREHIRAELPKLEPAFERVAGAAEWVVQVGFEPVAARKAEGGEPPAARDASGASFLKRKKKAWDDVRELKTRAQERVNGLYGELAKHAREARRLPPTASASFPGLRSLLHALYLVPFADEARFREVAARLREERLPQGYVVVAQGPFPPYNFVGEKNP
jgi:hypothetical protein